MANIRSAKKRHRQSLKRRARNMSWRSRVRTATRKLREAIAARDKATVEQQLPKTISEIMRASTKGILHWRTAQRKVARLSRAAHTVVSQSQK
ncbi:MAG: 30S ribosomal protein S20 [Deltaproteobacteria bacterium]|nr:MAG: 30S ribosomal protein S20 [Deltaproteobacteria bacterium]